jgi:predicted nucleic acid-binding protein
MIVVDANIIFALVVDQGYGAAARRLFDREPVIAVPDLWRYEVGHALWRNTRQGGLNEAELEVAASFLTRTFGHLEEPVAMAESLAAARRYGLSSAYDATYVALAERLGCPLVTMDKEVFKKAPMARDVGS